jgi:hypothetical protein
MHCSSGMEDKTTETALNSFTVINMAKKKAYSIFFSHNIAVHISRFNFNLKIKVLYLLISRDQYSQHHFKNSFSVFTSFSFFWKRREIALRTIQRKLRTWLYGHQGTCLCDALCGGVHCCCLGCPSHRCHHFDVQSPVGLRPSASTTSCAAATLWH